MRVDDLVLALVVLAGMALITYITRAGGVWAMGFVPLTPRIERFLRHLASSVVVAVLVGAAVKGDAAANAGLAASLALMATTRSTFLSLLIGIATAAGVRAVSGA